MVDVIRLGFKQPLPADTIFLGGPSAPRPLGTGTIRLGGTRKPERRGIFTGATPSEKFAKAFPKGIEETPVFKVITSPKLTAFAAGTLGTLLGGPIAGIKAFLAGGLVAGAIKTSPKVAEFVKEKILSPEKGGEFIGQLIEKPPKEFTKEGLTEALKQAGIFGGLAALGIGAATLTPKVIERTKTFFRERAAKKDVIAPQAAPTAFFQTIPAQPMAPLPTIEQPLGAVQPEPKKEVPVTPAQPMEIINKISVKPVTNVRVSQTRKFINQQVIIK